MSSDEGNNEFDQTERVKVEAIQTAYELWANESMVKTEKLRLFFIAQSVLVTGFVFGIPEGQVLIALIGMGTSYLLFLSIGRTDAYQTVWQDQAEHLVDEASEPIDDYFDLYPTSSDIQEMAWYKQISQEYIHYPPFAGFVVWIILLIVVIYQNFLPM